MGKEEGGQVKETSDSSATSNEKAPVADAKPEKKEETPNKPTTKPEDKKQDVDELRKIIKLGDQEKSSNTQKPEEKKEIPKKSESKEIDLDSTSRETLEQKRAILQSIKDFDFQIKKNQEEINSLNQKLDSVTKDLDDLVSLYEIVSEQMNPFVGLSKVTKKRLDALENFTKEIEDLKTRIGDIESFAERTGADFEAIKTQKSEIKEITTKNNSSSKLSSEDLDIIIEKSFNVINVDQKIDEAIDEFIEKLKM